MERNDNFKIRYQVFVSSTYEDLIEERKLVTQAILECGCFPAGMELFPASNKTQWEVIKQVIEESDIFLLIISGKYGSTTRGGDPISFTEMEFNYARSIKKPIVVLIRENIEELPLNKVERTEKGHKLLQKFTQSAKSNRLVKFWQNKDDLKSAVITSLFQVKANLNYGGWIKIDNDLINNSNELSYGFWSNNNKTIKNETRMNTSSIKEELVSNKNELNILQEKGTLENKLLDVKKKNNELIEEIESINKDLKRIKMEKSELEKQLKKKIFESVDALIITAITEEKAKIYDMFGLVDENDRQLINDGLTYQLSTIDGKCIVFVSQSKTGLTEAARAVESAINAFNPKIVIMGGICAGNQNNIGLGSIVIPKVIYDYSNGKVQKDDTEESFVFLLQDEPVKASSTMATFYQFMENPKNISTIIQQIESSYSGPLPEPSKKKTIVTYPMASGPVIVNSKEYFETIQKRIPNYKNCAIDMEAYAVARVAEIHNKPWVVIKTVQDYANGKKESDEAIARSYASFSSAKIIRLYVNKMIDCVQTKK